MMKRTLGLVSLSALLVALSTLADDKPKPKDDKVTPETLTKEMIDTFGKMANLFETVKDDKSAAAAKPKLSPLIAQMDQYNDRFSKLGAITPDVLKKLDEKFKAELDTIFTKWAAEYTRVKDQPYGKDLVEMLKSKVKPVAAATPPAMTTSKAK